MQMTDFPSEEIIDEFMQDPIDISPLQLNWGQPNVVKFVVNHCFSFCRHNILSISCVFLQKMMGKLIQWDEIYCFQKFLPLLTRWQLHHADDDKDTNNIVLRGCVQPDFIKKKRTPKGVPSYEIIWKDEKGCFHTLIPDQQLQMFYATNKEKTETEAFQLLWSTIEPMDLVEKAYPELVREFEESKAKSKSKKTKKSQDPAKVTKGRKAKNVNGLDQQEILDKVPKRVVPRANAKSKKKNDENVRSIDVFFRKQQTAPITVYSSPKIKTTTKPMNLSAFSLDFNDSIMSLEEDDMNLSAIINEMVSRPPNVTEFNGKKLKFDAIITKANEDLQVNVNHGKEKNEETKKLQKTNDAESEVGMTENSIDEFDLIVMRKMRKSLIGGRKSILSANSNSVNCSTPLSRHRDLRLNSLLKQSSDTSLMLETLTNRKNAVISSSFFAVNQEDEVDLFEKSIDFRNMQDVSDSDEESDSPHESSATFKSNQLNEDDVDHYDTFDRLVGVDI